MLVVSQLKLRPPEDWYWHLTNLTRYRNRVGNAVRASREKSPEEVLKKFLFFGASDADKEIWPIAGCTIFVRDVRRRKVPAGIDFEPRRLVLQSFVACFHRHLEAVAPARRTISPTKGSSKFPWPSQRVSTHDFSTGWRLIGELLAGSPLDPDPFTRGKRFTLIGRRGSG